MDALATGFVLSDFDRVNILAHLDQVCMPHAVCFKCCAETDISFLRKKERQAVTVAMCVPCFVKEYGNLSQEVIDKLIKIGHKNNWYF